jgi:putative transposase
MEAVALRDRITVLKRQRLKLNLRPRDRWHWMILKKAWPTREGSGIDYGSIFLQRMEGMGIKQKLISPRSPWQNPYVERLVGSIRRECLDRVIVFNERQLRRILQSYFEYYHKVRPHRSLSHDSPSPRLVESSERGKLIEMPLVGGLHHHYLRQAA